MRRYLTEAPSLRWSQVRSATDEESAGLSDYADAVMNAVGNRTELILVAQPLAAFTGPLVCARAPVRHDAAHLEGYRMELGIP
jgi:hypothetical protein